jgi:N-acetyl sugar amidotransferase
MNICNRCILDENIPNIEFDELGNCNYCENYLLQKKSNITKVNHFTSFNNMIETIKKTPVNNPYGYNCVIGVSGGVDSSFVLHHAVKSGLKPLAVHMDNNWNSELAQSNISNLITILGVDLYTYVIDWEEYRALMNSFFDADVIDVELLYDNALAAVNLMIAKKFNIKYILNGQNIATEGMALPIGWNWFKYDSKNIRSIAKKFGKVKIKSFPLYSSFDFFISSFFYKIKNIPYLDYLDFKKKEAIEILRTNYNYVPYPYKHYESIFTRFYQGFILPNKFNVDKRKIHLATLVMNNEISRLDAINMLKLDPYPNLFDKERDKHYFLKKMKWDKNKLDNYINRKEKLHSMYGSEFYLFKFIINIYMLFKKVKEIIRAK